MRALLSAIAPSQSAAGGDPQAPCRLDGGHLATLHSASKSRTLNIEQSMSGNDWPSEA